MPRQWQWGHPAVLSPQCDMQKLTVDELKRLLYDTFCEHLSMKDIENIIMTEEESHMGTAEECPVDVESECRALSRSSPPSPPQRVPGARGGVGGHSGVTPRALSAPRSLLQPADPPDLRAQEPHLRLRHRLHHQRDAHRRQPGAAQRHEVAGPPPCAPTGDPPPK